VRQYLLGTTSDPHCMNCKKAWSQNFMVMKLNRSFITTDYKKHRSSLLIQREISKLPETMQFAEQHKNAELKEQQGREMNIQITKLNTEMNKLRYEQSLCYREASNLRNNRVKEEKKKFIMPCPSEKCRGFLSTQYKCGFCNMYTCPKCIEIIGPNKNIPHTCNEENVKSAELIRKETKPCPSCGTRISKIDGCDQMWCIECHKAFSWKTGKIDNGTIHNPHFYQYQRNNNNGTVPRAPGDVVCGGLCSYYDVRKYIIPKLKVDMSLVTANLNTINNNVVKKCDELLNIHRTLIHITHITLHDIREKVTRLSNYEQMRIDYILQKITKNDMENTIYKNDIQRRKLTEQLHIYELFNTVGIEMFTALVNSKNNENTEVKFIDEVNNRINEYNNLRIYCNEEFSKMSVTYNQVAPKITDTWVLTTQITRLNKAKNTIIDKNTDAK
tara:strand:- start:2235 stop:3563 length:1329 start_codon:yes stop_codon:yes gene_type:complete